MPVDAAEGGGHPDRAADVGADLERAEPGRDRGRATAAAAARGAPEVPGIAGPPVDRVGRLPVREHGRHVGLAEEHRAGGPGAGGDRRVVLRDEGLPVRHPAGRVETGDVDRLLEGHRQPEQGRALPAAAGVLGPDRLLPGAGEVAHDHRVQRAVVALDAADVELGQLRGADRAVTKRGQERGGGGERVDGGHGGAPFSYRTQPPWTG